MTEAQLQFVQIIKLLIIAVCAGLYGFGGMRGKWKRRFIAPALATLGIVGINAYMGTSHILNYLFFPLLAGSYSIGYGVSSKLMKIFKNKLIVRAIVGLALGVAALPVAIASSAYILLALHILICVLVSTVSGALNPMKSARAEETMIGATSLLTVMFMF